MTDRIKQLEKALEQALKSQEVAQQLSELLKVALEEEKVLAEARKVTPEMMQTPYDKPDDSSVWTANVHEESKKHPERVEALKRLGVKQIENTVEAVSASMCQAVNSIYGLRCRLSSNHPGAWHSVMLNGVTEFTWPVEKGS